MVIGSGAYDGCRQLTGDGLPGVVARVGAVLLGSRLEDQDIASCLW